MYDTGNSIIMEQHECEITARRIMEIAIKASKYGSHKEGIILI